MIWKYLERNDLVRSRDDKILRLALFETLDLLGEENKRILLQRLGITDKAGKKVKADEGYLDYKKVIEEIVQTFASAATPLLRLLDEKIEKYRSRIVKSS